MKGFMRFVHKFFLVLTICISSVMPSDAQLKNIAENFKLTFFYLSYCPHCKAQSKDLLQLQEDYGFEIDAYSLNGKPLKPYEFKEDHSLWLKTNAKSAPAIVLQGKHTSHWIPLAEGRLELNELKNEILEALN